MSDLILVWCTQCDAVKAVVPKRLALCCDKIMLELKLIKGHNHDEVEVRLPE